MNRDKGIFTSGLLGGDPDVISMKLYLCRNSPMAVLRMLKRIEIGKLQKCYECKCPRHPWASAPPALHNPPAHEFCASTQLPCLCQWIGWAQSQCQETPCEKQAANRFKGDFKRFSRSRNYEFEHQSKCVGLVDQARPGIDFHSQGMFSTFIQ